MNDFDRINTPRVEKIFDTLDLIDKSARSNKVFEAFEHAALLEPLYVRLRDLGCDFVGSPKETPTVTPEPAQSAPCRVGKGNNENSIREFLAGLSESEIGLTLCLLASRIEDDIYWKGKVAQ